MLGVTLVWLTAMAGATDDEPWSITFPPLWSDVTAERMGADPDLGRIALPSGARQELHVYSGPDGASILLHFVELPPNPADRGAAIANWEAGAHAGLEGQAGTRTVTYQQRRDGDAFVTDVVAERNAQRLYVRRVAGLDPRGNLVGLTATCLGRESTCLPVLRTARLTIALAPARMPAPPASVPRSESRFLLWLVGGTVGAGLLLGVMFSLARGRGRRGRVTSSRAPRRRGCRRTARRTRYTARHRSGRAAS